MPLQAPSGALFPAMVDRAAASDHPAPGLERLNYAQGVPRKEGDCWSRVAAAGRRDLSLSAARSCTLLPGHAPFCQSAAGAGKRRRTCVRGGTRPVVFKPRPRKGVGVEGSDASKRRVNRSCGQGSFCPGCRLAQGERWDPLARSRIGPGSTIVNILGSPVSGKPRFPGHAPAP